MSVSLNKIFSFTLFFLFSLAPAFGQTSKSDLEKKKRQLQREIEQTDKLIKETRKNKNATLGQLKILNKKLDDRKKLIRTIQGEVKFINSNISTTSSKIKSLQNDVDKLKASYGKLIRQAYLNRNKESVLMLLYSSEDVQQAYKRLYYLRKYNTYRREQAEMLKAASDELNSKQMVLQADLKTKSNLLGSEEKQEKELSKEKVEQQQTVNSLSKKEKTLKKDLSKKRADAKKLDKEIQRIIEREIEREREKALAKARAEAEAARKKALAEGKPVPKETEIELKVTPETMALSGKFEANKGKLPWPVSKGVITESFGSHPHALLKGIVTNNNGIDITTTDNATVKAIYDGVVTGVISIPGSNRAVILKHGEYLSVYSNLANVVVNKGDKIGTGQTLGTADTDNETGKSLSHLEIWKGKVKLNPADWIAR
ncbi:MAG: peptidoglycan DD-metalloendopeptidase family protein [Bacteroidia bacterium]